MGGPDGHEDIEAQRGRFQRDPRRHPMTPASGGWHVFRDSEPDALSVDPFSAEETNYGFSLDGSPLVPDPRSTRQPWGVHGPSRRVDHQEFAWSDGGWSGLHLPSAVLYEMHVGTFTPRGTFDAAIERLDHLVGLGVGAVELMPVAAFPGRRGWGYDGVGLWAVQEGYGGPYFTDRYRTPWGRAVNFDGRGSDEVRRGRRREFAEFGWSSQDAPDPQDPETFGRSRLRWDEVEEEPHVSFLLWIRDLVRLRRDHPALADGCLDRVRVRFDETERWLTMRRGGMVTVGNFSGRDVRVPVPGDGDGDVAGDTDWASGSTDFRIHLASHPEARSERGIVILPAGSAVVLVAVR